MSTIYGHRIVKDGLVFCIDAANTRSYPGSGTTWTELSGNGSSGALYNGPTFSTDGGGCIVFDGVDDVAVFNSATGSSTNPLNYVTISSWVNITTKKASAYILAKGWGDCYELIASVNNTITFQVIGSSSGSVNSTYNLLTNTWYYVTGVYDQVNITLYLNGIYNNSNPFALSMLQNSHAIGVGGIHHMISAYPNYGVVGQIGISMIYNRALTAAEVLQNYNALKGRFGL